MGRVSTSAPACFCPITLLLCPITVSCARSHLAVMKLLWFLSFLALLVAAYAVKDKDCVNKPGYECEEYDDEELEFYCTDDPEAHGQFTTVCCKACEPFLNLK